MIELRFGLQDDRPRTLEEVGRQFGLTRERIRQIEAKTIMPAARLPRDRAPARVSGVKGPVSHGCYTVFVNQEVMHGE